MVLIEFVEQQIWTSCWVESPKRRPIFRNQGSHYAWGPDRVLSNPGRYSLCWCAAVTSCDAYQDFESYAAVLQASTHLDWLDWSELGRSPPVTIH